MASPDKGGATMNKERKQQFLNEIYNVGNIKLRMSSKDILLAVRCMEIVESLEIEWKQDIAEQTYVVVNRSVESIAKKLHESNFDTGYTDETQLKIAIASVLFLYNRWCREHKYPANIEITRSKWVKEAKGAMWVVKDPQHLQSVLDETLTPEAAKTSDLVARGVAWLAYAGLTRREILTVPVSALDLKKMVITIKRGEDVLEISLPKECRLCMSLLAQLDSFIKFSSQYISGVSEQPRYQSDRLTRAVAKVRENQTGRRAMSSEGPENEDLFVVNMLYKAKATRGVTLTYDGLLKSGFYYRAYLEEQEQGIFFPADEPIGRKSRLPIEVHIPELDRFVEFKVSESKNPSPEIVWRRKIYNGYRLWKRVCGHK